jgi:hypothetical protein
MEHAVRRELEELLSQASASSTPDALSPSTSEADDIDLCIDVMSGFELGDYDRSEVKALFDQYAPKGFDVLLWIQGKVDEGYYLPEDLSEIPEHP